MKTVLGFLRTSGVYVLGSVLSRLVGFLLLPLITAFVAPEQMGYYDLSVVYATLAYEFIFMNIWVVILRYMHDSSGEERMRALAPGLVLFLSSTVLYMATAGVVAVVAAPEHIWWVAFYGLSISLSYLTGYTCRGLGRSVDFAVSGVVNAIVTAALNIWLLVGLSFDISALYIAGIAGYLAQSIYLEIRVGILRRLRWHWFTEIKATALRSMLLYALPIGFTAMVYWFINSFNRVVVSGLLTLEDNGIFAVAARWGSLLAVVLTAMSFAWQEIAFRRGTDGPFFGRAATLYFAALAASVAVLMPAVRLVFPWFVDPAYDAALAVIPTTLLAAAFSGYFNFVVSIFYAAKNSRGVFWGAVVAAVANVGLTIPLIAVLGLQGANLSAVLAFAFGLLVLHLILRRRMDFRFGYWRAGAALLLPLASSLVFWFLDPIWNLVWLVALAAVALTASLVWWRVRSRAMTSRESPKDPVDDYDAAIGDEREG